MRPTSSSKRDRHELRLMKKHRRERDRKRSTTPSISSASPPPTKHRRGVDEEDEAEEDDCELVSKKTSSKKRRRHEEEDGKKLKKKKKLKKRSEESHSETIKTLDDSHEPESIDDPAALIVVDEEPGKKLHSRGKGQAWSAEEDMTMVRMLLEAGERTANWVQILNAINHGRTNVRSMASVKGHWFNVLRSHAMVGKVHRKPIRTTEANDDEREETEVIRAMPASPPKTEKRSSSKKHKKRREAQSESDAEPEPEASSPIGSDL